MCEPRRPSPQIGNGNRYYLRLVALIRSDAELAWLMAPEAPPLLTLADLFPPLPPWMADGACRNRPDVTWFPDKGQPAGPAKAVCLSECPCRAACLAYAMETGAVGIWGGTSDRERQALRKVAGKRRRLEV